MEQIEHGAIIKILYIKGLKETKIFEKMKSVLEKFVPSNAIEKIVWRNLNLVLQASKINIAMDDLEQSLQQKCLPKSI